jgi:membrane protease YdiL (CAAX protease family)
MHAIGLSSGVYVAYILLLVPWIAFRSARLFNAPAEVAGATRLPPLERILASTIASLVVLFSLAWFTARAFHDERSIFFVPGLGVSDVAAGCGALLFWFALMYAGHRLRTADERRAMPVDRLTPRTQREKALYAVTSIFAGVAEEAAYRGTLFWILSYAFGNLWIAVFISATAFALGHAVQGWKSMLTIFIMACSLHALVWYTGTLVIAMAAHAAYDLLAPTVRRRILPEPPRDPGRIAG